jgi:hypothetical protein
MYMNPTDFWVPKVESDMNFTIWKYENCYLWTDDDKSYKSWFVIAIVYGRSVLVINTSGCYQNTEGNKRRRDNTVFLNKKS